MTTVTGRLIHKADFESLMAAPIWSRSAHFAAHHLARAPGLGEELAGKLDRGPTAARLSTRWSEGHPLPVDNNSAPRWLGAVVPKRHARRAVTRNLLKRQIRAAFGRREDALPAGLWLVRLRRPFAPAEFVSASSRALAETVQTELEQLLRLAAAVPVCPGSSRRAGRGGAGAGPRA
ncbi:MAG: ribonuclease P protein component [Rubrivivax sp.]